MSARFCRYLEAVESLLLDGYVPKRSVYIALGHDEEIMGAQGARLIGQHLEKELGPDCFEVCTRS